MRLALIEGVLVGVFAVITISFALIGRIVGDDAVLVPFLFIGFIWIYPQIILAPLGLIAMVLLAFDWFFWSNDAPADPEESDDKDDARKMQ